MDDEDTIDQSGFTPEELAEAGRYAIVIEWSTENDAFIVSVPDMPGFHTHGATREEAATMGDDLIATLLLADRELGNQIPSPRFSALNAFVPPANDAERIRQIRKRLGLLERQFAEILNVSLETVYAWEQGLRTPNGAALRLLDLAERHPDLLTEASFQPPRRWG
jgi:DNA-binding transcriptional regulator YiaG